MGLMTGAPEPRIGLLLLSGGLDSAALAAWLKPAHALFIDYGQRPAKAEGTAARAVAEELSIPFSSIEIDLSPVGSGLLADDRSMSGAPSPEWWPFRNQLLVSIAAGWAIGNLVHATGGSREVEVLTGTVRSDGRRHLDGTEPFYVALNNLLGEQEGGISVSAPAIAIDAAELVTTSGIEDSTLAWTHSCHRANYPCQECPGCYKRDQVLSALGRLL
jgi:7-cyano-7-deazaguanine synthase